MNEGVRVYMTDKGVLYGLSGRMSAASDGRFYGTVLDAKRSTTGQVLVKVKRDGMKTPGWYGIEFWEQLDPASDAQREMETFIAECEAAQQRFGGGNFVRSAERGDIADVYERMAKLASLIPPAPNDGESP